MTDPFVDESGNFVLDADRQGSVIEFFISLLVERDGMTRENAIAALKKKGVIEDANQEEEEKEEGQA